MGLAGEVGVMRDRMDTIERLLDEKGLLKIREIEAYQPSASVAAERAAWRETFLSEILRIIEIELEAAAIGDTQPYQEAIQSVEEGATGGTRKKRRKK